MRVLFVLAIVTKLCRSFRPPREKAMARAFIGGLQIKDLSGEMQKVITVIRGKNPKVVAPKSQSRYQWQHRLRRAFKATSDIECAKTVP